MNERGMLLAYVYPRSGGDFVGLVLDAHGAFRDELETTGSVHLSDYDVTPPPVAAGLYVLEGQREWSAGPDPDTELCGEWRYPTERELFALMAGKMPWEVDAP